MHLIINETLKDLAKVQIKSEKLTPIGEFFLHSNTGTPEELAQKLHVSKRQLYNLVDEFRAMGASIKYSRESKTYYYTNDKKCHFSAKKT